MANPLQQASSWDAAAKGFTSEWDMTGPFCDAALRLAVGLSQDAESNQVVDRLKSRGTPLQVLDVAAGAGALSLRMGSLLKESGIGGKIVGTDFAPKMVEEMKHKLSQTTLDNVEAKVMDGQVRKATLCIR